MSVKNDLLYALEKNKGEEISGQALADKLGVTRAAIWKAVKALQEDGYLISATRNKGYRLEKTSDIISEQGIRSYIDDSMKDWEIIVLQTVDSTNTYAKSILGKLSGKSAIIIALCQTAGKGRHGHSFYSPKDTGIYMSVVIRPDISPSTLITAAAAVAVCLTCEELTESRPQIKWVNDVFLGNKKICGILTEGIIDFETQNLDNAIVGIGVNLSTSDFPDGVDSVACSVFPKNATKNMFIAKIVSNLQRLVSTGKEEIISEYRRRLMVLGKSVSYTMNGETHTGIAKGINEIGNLIVETDFGTDVLTAGEISLNKDFLNK